MPTQFRRGRVSRHERAIVKAVVSIHEGKPVPENAIRALRALLHRSPDQTRTLIDQCQSIAVGHLPDYVEVLHTSTLEAARKGQHDVALKSAQWALEHIGQHGRTVVEKPVDSKTHGAIQIGIALGGVKQPVKTIRLPNPPAVIDEPDDTEDDE